MYEFIEGAENKIRFEDVSVTKVLEYGPTILLHKIATMIGLQEAIEKRCKENDDIPKIVERILIDGSVITSEGTKCELLTYG